MSIKDKKYKIFTKHGAYTNKGLELSDEIYAALNQVFQDWKNKVTDSGDILVVIEDDIVELISIIYAKEVKKTDSKYYPFLRLNKKLKED